MNNILRPAGDNEAEESAFEERIKEEIRISGLRCEAYNVGAMWQNYEPRTLEEIIARQNREIPLQCAGY